MKFTSRLLLLVSLCLNAGLFIYILYKAEQSSPEFTPVCGASRRQAMENAK